MKPFKRFMFPLLILTALPLSCKEMEDFVKTSPAEIVQSMTLEEKVGQIIHVGVPGKVVTETMRAGLKQYHVGGVIFFAGNLGNPTEIKTFTDGLQKIASESERPVPYFISVDQEGGRVLRITEGVDQFPGALAVGQAGSESMAHDVGFITGLQLKRLGIPLLLAPDVDVNNNPANPVINIRSFGGDAEVVKKIALSFARGVRASGAVPVLKHFPGHGNTGTDSHTALPTIKTTLEDLEKIEIVPYRAGIAEGSPAIMSAHILFPALDANEPATLSPHILKEYLRGKLGFQGLIITDALEMKAVADKYPPDQLGKKAFVAGADVLLLTAFGPRLQMLYDSLLKGFKSGELNVADLDAACERQIRLKIQSGLFHEFNMVRPTWSDHLRREFQEKQAEADNLEKEVRSRYPAGLNTEVSRQAVKSLRKPFDGIKVSPSVRIFYRNGGTQAIALEQKLDKSQLIYSASPIAAAAATMAGFCRVGCDQIIAIELSDWDLWRWNMLVDEWNAKPLPNKPVLIGLHSGNPYLPIKIPASGAVISSFSPTDESQKALINRLFTPVGRAEIVLGPE